MKLKALLSALLVAGIATSLAVASPPPGKGRAAERAAKAKPASLDAKRERAAEARAERRPVVMLMLKGDFVSASGGSFAMLVKHSNKHARSLRGKQVTVKVDDKTKLRRQGKGKAQLSDLLAGDRLHVLVRARKDADAGSLELLARLVHARPAKPKRDEDDEDGDTTTSATTTTTSSTTSSTNTGTTASAD